MKGYKLKKQSYSKKDIIRRASYKLNMSINESKILCDCFFGILQEMLVDPTERVHIEIRNFGIFDIKKYSSRTNALNPRTKEKVIIPARKKISFKPSKKIKELIYNRSFE